MYRRLVGKVEFDSGADVDSGGTTIFNRVDIDQLLNVESGLETILIDSRIEGDAGLFTGETISLKGVFATGTVYSGGGADMRVIRVDGNRAYINVGSAAGIKVGDRFTIHRMGEPLIDPATGMNLGSDEKQVGTAVVAEVQERFAIVTVTGQAAAADVIKKR